MTIEERFALAIAVMAVVTLTCRVGGLLIGSYLGGSARLRRLLDILPACAIAAVLGPLVLHADWPQLLALATAGLAYRLTAGFLLSLALGTAVLLLAGPLLTLPF